MLQTILGTKQKMGQAFVNEARVPVTIIHAGPCVVTQIKNNKKDGYWAVQIGLGEKKLKNITKPLKGHLKGVTSKKAAPRFLREVRLDSEPKGVKVGDKFSVSDIFSVGETISVSGISKGKGFAGGMKRWGFAGGPATHGQSDRPRSPGSIGQGTTPGRVWKGKKMAGRMGTDKVTIKNIKVIAVDPEKGELAVSGPVPGAPGTLLIIRKTKEVKKSDE